MKQHRFVAFIASAFVLYVTASAGAADVVFDTGSVVLLLVAAVCALTPLGMSRGEPEHGLRSVSLLSASAAVLLAAWLAFAVHALLGEVVCALVLPIAGTLVLRLALSVPDVPPRLSRHVGSELWLRAAYLVASALGVAAALPPVWLWGRPLIAPHWLARAPLSFALSCLVLAAGVRLARRRLGSDARALSANIWPTLGISLALLSLGLALATSWLKASTRGAEHVMLAAAAGLLALGHVWLVSPRRVLVASAWARELLAVALSFSLSACALVWVDGRGPKGALGGVLCYAVAVSIFAVSRVFFRKLSRRLLAPHGGRLLDAIDEAKTDIAGASTYDVMAARVLRPLRRASGSPEAAPLFVCFHPLREVRLDAAGQPRASARGLYPAIEQRLRDMPGDPIVRDDLAGRLVRRPELRDLVWALHELDALCVMPLMGEGDLEGAIVLARGARKHPLSLEELQALDALARWVAPMASVLLMAERAHERTVQATTQRNELKSRVDDLEDEVALLRAQANLLKAGRAAVRARNDVIAYSAGMRELLAKLEAVAVHDVTVLLVSEPGTPLAPLARVLHEASGRGEAPFVVGDCGELAPEEGMATLFGSPSVPGWLELAGEGTLVLLDVAALEPAVQQALSAALAERRARGVDSEAAYAVHARLVTSLRRPLDELVALGVVVPELGRWLESACYRVPPLRERREDIESLVLMTLDRAARVGGHKVQGIEADALLALADNEWPGNVLELETVVQRAAAQAEGARVTLDDLPALPVGRASAGSYMDQEREILRRALERAGGNKTRAARALGLKRTALIDKLRRLGLEEIPGRTQH